MAKPKPSSSSPSLATSKTILRPKQSRDDFTHGSRRRPFNTSSVPSSGLLAFLAGLTASSSAYGHPVDTNALPPDFLCPGLGSDHPSETLAHPSPSSRRRAERRDDADQPQPSGHHSNKRDSKRPYVPPKYVQGEDGRWRKIANWTLYGYCNCEPTSTEYATLPVTENDVEATSTSTILPSDSLAGSTIMEDQLPPGWKSDSETDHVLTYIILVLSLILAIVICIFMIGCVAWRKKRKNRRKDLEKTASSSSLHLGSDEEDESEDIKQAKKQQKLWARASARWKANVRISARRRRVQRSISNGNSLARASRTSLASTTAASSCIESPMPSSVDVSDTSPSSNTSRLDRQHVDEPELSSTSPTPSIEQRLPTVPVSSRPPSYLRNSQTCPAPHLGDTIERPPPPESRAQPVAHPSSSHKAPNVQTTTSEDVIEEDLPPSPYDAPPTDIAHVATDDKNVLARMAAMASAPPATDADDRAGNSSGPSVPILEYELDHYEDHPDLTSSGPSSGPAHMPPFLAPPLPHSELSLSPPAPSYSSNPNDPSTQHPLFPSPPSKGTLVVPSFYEYPASFEEDVLNAEPTAEPSAPPFELEEEPLPSAPPDESGGGQSITMSDSTGSLVPSAPPILDDRIETVPENQPHGFISASAPSFEDIEDVDERPGSSSRTYSDPRSAEIRTSAPDLPSYLP